VAKEPASPPLPPARTTTLALLACGALLLGLPACGGSPTTHSSSTPSHATTASVWASQTQQLCREKRAAIASLGYVHITYAGIARIGLPAVKGILDRYLLRLLAVLRTFSQRQHQLTTPPAFVSTMAVASEVDGESQAATIRVQQSVAGANSPAGLTAAFGVWLATLQRLSARGDALAQQLNLPACRSGSAATP
jgi:hypothetical protein